MLARWTIVPRLLGVSGVADVSTFGEADRQLQVLVDPARLAARHITLAQIIETAGNAQLVSPLSYLEGSRRVRVASWKARTSASRSSSCCHSARQPTWARFR